MTGRRRPRGAAGLGAVLLMTVLIGTVPGAWAHASAAPVQDCTMPTIPGGPCPPDTTEAPTTTTTEAVESSTTTERSTTTTSRQTTTTRSAAQRAATATTTSIVSTRNLLVPGDGTEGAQLTTTTEGTPSAAGSSGPSDSTLIALMIFNLLLIATVVGVLTRRYWRATEPPTLPRNPAPRSAR